MATTTVAVYRGETTNAAGDQVPTTTPLPGLLLLPFSVIEKSRTVFVQATSELRTIRYFVGRCRPGVDLRKLDRLKDNLTQRWYAVDEVTGGDRSIAGMKDLVLDLRRL